MTSDTELTVQENLSIYAKLYGVKRDERRRAIKELLEIVGLTKWRDAEVHTLSGGMRRRVEVARGLVHSPKILFLDEPTTGLDPVSRVDVWEMLEKIQRERQLTILLTTHYMEEADRLCAAEQMPQSFGPCTVIGGVQVSLTGASRFPENFKISRNCFHKSGRSRRRSQIHREWLLCWRQLGILPSG